MSSPHRAVEAVARASYGRLLGWLARHGGDLQRAEDALGDALLVALEVWPDQGVPDRPEAWLLTTARRRRVDAARRSSVAERYATVWLAQVEERAAQVTSAFPDRRVEWMFATAHPRVPPGIRAPLMLQVVLGLTVSDIAPLFLLAPSTLAQRLVRAKRQLVDAEIELELPVGDALRQRLGPVLEAVYGLACRRESREGLDEAVWLMECVLSRFPLEPEVLGLVSHLHFVRARCVDGPYRPIAEQDVARWDSTDLEVAEDRLWRAHGVHERPGRFQLEAAIQSVLVEGRRNDAIPWSMVADLYAGLAQTSGHLDAYVGWATALREAGLPVDALTVLDGIEPRLRQRSQPWWAVRAFVLRDLGRDAEPAFEQALGLCRDGGVRQWLLAVSTPR